MTRTCGILLSAASEMSHLPALTPEEELVRENIIYMIEKAILGLLFLLKFMFNIIENVLIKNWIRVLTVQIAEEEKYLIKHISSRNWTQDLQSQYTTYKAREVAILFLFLNQNLNRKQSAIDKSLVYIPRSISNNPPTPAQNYWKNLTLKHEARYSSCTTCPMLVLDACGKCGSSLCTTNMTSTLRDKADPSSSASSTSLSTSSCIAGAEISRFKSKSIVWL